MLDFIRDIGKPQAKKDHEMLNAYIDGQLNPADNKRMEQNLGADPALQAEADQMLVLKQQLRAIPSRRVPRSFVLDPTVYGAPESRSWSTAYPVLRTATALTALLFVFLLGLSLVQGSFGGGEAATVAGVFTMEQAQEAAIEAAEAPLAAEAQLAPEAAESTAATITEEAIEEAAVESFGLPEEGEAELALPPEALDLSSATMADETAAANGAADDVSPDERSARDDQPATSEAAAALTVPETAEAVQNENTTTSVPALLTWALLGLGLVLVVLLLLTGIARRQNSP